MTTLHADLAQNPDLQDFPLAWRLSEPYLQETRLVATLRLVPVQTSSAFDQYGKTFRVKDQFCVASQTSLAEETDEGVKQIEQWLKGLGIADKQQVYVNWFGSAGTALMMDWEVFVELWSDLWYPFDAVDVFDASLEWAVLFGREEEALFVRRVHHG